jgi:hypothetical protein
MLSLRKFHINNFEEIALKTEYFICLDFIHENNDWNSWSPPHPSLHFERWIIYDSSSLRNKITIEISHIHSFKFCYIFWWKTEINRHCDEKTFALWMKNNFFYNSKWCFEQNKSSIHIFYMFVSSSSLCFDMLCTYIPK